MRYFLRLAYDGSAFHGWQRQPNAMSVQQKIEEALFTMLRTPIEITGAGRTDSGVHAREMYAHLDMAPIKDKEKFLKSFNRLLGPQVAVYDLLPVNDEAHARFDAISRQYKYHISLSKDPFIFHFAHRMDRTPDIEKMNEAASILLETDDFTSFAKLHSDSKTGICKVTEANWSLRDNDEKLVFTITADRFLRNMVRSVVGTLIDVGKNKLTIEGFKRVITDCNRCSAGVSMPAKGLFLNRIVYPKEIFI